MFIMDFHRTKGEHGPTALSRFVPTREVSAFQFPRVRQSYLYQLAARPDDIADLKAFLSTRPVTRVL